MCHGQARICACELLPMSDGFKIAVKRIDPANRTELGEHRPGVSAAAERAVEHHIVRR
jgi:hypothetical protein